MWLRGASNQHVNISEIDKIFVINNGIILVNTVILAAKEVIYAMRKTGGLLSRYKLKHHLFSKIISEEYWSLLENETDLFLRKPEGIAIDL